MRQRQRRSFDILLHFADAPFPPWPPLNFCTSARWTSVARYEAALAAGAEAAKRRTIVAAIPTRRYLFAFTLPALIVVRLAPWELCGAEWTYEQVR